MAWGRPSSPTWGYQLFRSKTVLMSEIWIELLWWIGSKLTLKKGGLLNESYVA